MGMKYRRNPIEESLQRLSADDIQKAYRKLAKKLHPDLNPRRPEAEEKFKEVASAYDLVGNEEKRKTLQTQGLGAIRATGTAPMSRSHVNSTSVATIIFP